MTWDLDVEAVLRACRFLGLSKPVMVQVVPEGMVGSWDDGRLEDIAGYYSWVGLHSVEVSGLLDHETASRVCWHELAHAAQAERSGNCAAFSSTAGEGPGSPVEMQACEMEDFDFMLRLTVSRDVPLCGRAKIGR